MPIGLIAFSFALELEPNPCNVRIAKIVKRIVDESKEPVVIVAQWEVAMAYERMFGIRISHVVFPVPENRYFKTDDVVKSAIKYFRSRGDIGLVIPVAQRGLHLLLCKRLIKKAGFKILSRPIGKVGFYKKSLQPWTRSPLHLSWYAISKCFGGDGIKAPESVDEQWREYKSRRAAEENAQ
jgi:hypothetical protein